MLKPKIFFLLLLFLFSSEANADEFIAYSHLTDGYWQIWVMKFDGSQQHRVTNSHVDKRDPSWLSGGRIAYRTNDGRLFVVDVEKNTGEEILPQFKMINNPDFSSVTNEILFVRFDPRSPDISGIWKMALDGQKPILLTREKAFVYQPAFSPQADIVAFVKAEPNKIDHHLWIMSALGGANSDGDAKQLTQGPGYHTLPDFSPDGQWITFSSNRDGDYEIYLINIHSKEMIQLTDNENLDTSSCFSPDGESIIFVSDRGGNQQIWMMPLLDQLGPALRDKAGAKGTDMNGANPKQLTRGQDESIDPAWSP